MNVRKPVDYRTMYQELATILAQNLSQAEEAYAIGKAISQRPEKGAAVAAAEFLRANFPDCTGFSPRNVRRMRDFYRTYENDRVLLQIAMKIGWTLSVVIMEAELTREQQIFCFKKAAVAKFSKKELLELIRDGNFAEETTDESSGASCTVTYLGKDEEGQERQERQEREARCCRALKGEDTCTNASLLLPSRCSVIWNILSIAFYFSRLRLLLDSS